MKPIVLRDPDAARQYLLQGLWFQRASYPSAATVNQALTWSLAIADAGQPLPPTGFVADLGHIALGKDSLGRAHREIPAGLGWPAKLARTYEDHVLGKLYADWSFERAGDSLKRIEPAKQPVGLAFIVKQIRERSQLGGVEFSPGIIRGLLTNAKPEENLRRGWELLNQNGPMDCLLELYEQIIAAARHSAEALALEDVIALEQKTALLTMGEYVAHRQVLQMAARLEHGLPQQKVQPFGGRREAPTRIFDEDAYPVGGFSSISTRGTMESLLQSQLAYMENDKDKQPDLFDVKFLRDELYYYSRDENQFLRRRRSLLFVLHPELANARFKDADLPCQRLVLVLALALSAFRKLSEWLSDEALHFEFLFIEDEVLQPLTEEMKLLHLLFREQVENNIVRIESLTAEKIGERIKQQCGRSQCNCLLVSVNGLDIQVNDSPGVEMRVNAARPDIRLEDGSKLELEGDEPFEFWVQALLRLLQLWV